MKILSMFSTLFSKQHAPVPAKADPVAPASPVAPVIPMPRPPQQQQQHGKKGAQKGRQPGPQPALKSVKGQPPPAKKPGPAPIPVSSGPHLAPVGARGETDLAPSHASFEGVTFPSVQGSGDDVDRAAIRELFADIAAGQAAPIKTFIGDLRAKNATGEWLQVCRPLMAVLVESASSLGMADAVAPMNEFISALDLAAESQEGDDKPIDGAARDVLLEAYEGLAKVFPEAFALGGAPASRRDTMLLHALLKQVQGVGVVTFDALYGASLTSVDVLAQAKYADLAAVTGLAGPLCDAICAAIHEHLGELERLGHLPVEQRFSGRLTELLRTLAREHDAFERVDGETGFDEARAERKRAARRNRNLLALKIEATLLEMGEVDCADALRVVSFDRRIEHMENFLGVRVAKRAAEHR
jgi:hypothetical protein